MDEPRHIAVTLAELAENPGDEGRGSGIDEGAPQYPVDGSLQEVRNDDLPNNRGSQEVAEASISAHESPSSHNAENNTRQPPPFAESHRTEIENANDDRDAEETSNDLNRGYNTNPHVLEDNVDNVNRHSFAPMVRGIAPMVDIGMPDDIPDIFWDEDVDDFVVVSNRAREIAESLPYAHTDAIDSSALNGRDRQNEGSAETSHQAFSSGSRVHPVRQNLANSMRQYGNILSLEQIDQFGHAEAANSQEDSGSRHQKEEGGRQSLSSDRLVPPVAVDRVEEYHRQESPSCYERPRHENSVDNLDVGIQDESMSNNVVMNGPDFNSSENNPSSDSFEMGNDKDGNTDNNDEYDRGASESPGSSLSETDGNTSNDSINSESDVAHSASTVDALKRVLEEMIPAHSNPYHGQEKGEATKTPHPSLYSEIAEEAPSSENTIDDDGDADVENVADAEFDFQSVSPACPETVVVARERTDADADALLNRVINEEPDDCLMTNEYGFQLMGAGNNSNCGAPVADGKETDKAPNVEDCDVSLHNVCAVETSMTTTVDVLNKLEENVRGDDLKTKEISGERSDFNGMKDNYNSVISKSKALPSIDTVTAKEFEQQGTIEVEQTSPAHATEGKIDNETVGQTGHQGNNIFETNEEPGDKAENTPCIKVKDQNLDISINPGGLNHVVAQESKKNTGSFETNQRIRTISNSVPVRDSYSICTSSQKTNRRQPIDSKDLIKRIDKVGDKFVPETPNDRKGDNLNSGDGRRSKPSNVKPNLKASRIILEATDLWMAEDIKKRPRKETKKTRLKSIATKVSQMVVGSSARPVTEDQYHPYQSSQKSKSGRMNVSDQERVISVPSTSRDAKSLEKSTTKAKIDSSSLTRPGSTKFRRVLGYVKNKAASVPSSTGHRETGQQHCNQDKATTLPAVNPRPEKMPKNTERSSKDSKNICATQIPEDLINHGVHQLQNYSTAEVRSAEDNSLSRCPARRCTPYDSEVSENKNAFLQKLNNSSHERADESCLGNDTSSTTVSSIFSTLSASFREARYEQQKTLPPCPSNQRGMLNSTMFGPPLQKSKVEPYKLYIPKKHLKPAETSAEEYHRYKMDLRMSENLSKVRPTVDCHMDPRLIKKRLGSKDRQRFPQRARDNSLLTVENVKFMEVLKYKKSNYRHNDLSNDCKRTTVTQRHIREREMDKIADKTCVVNTAHNGPHRGASLKSKVDGKRQQLPIWKPTKSRV